MTINALFVDVGYNWVFVSGEDFWKMPEKYLLYDINGPQEIYCFSYVMLF